MYSTNSKISYSMNSIDKNISQVIEIHEAARRRNRATSSWRIGNITRFQVVLEK